MSVPLYNIQNLDLSTWTLDFLKLPIQLSQYPSTQRLQLGGLSGSTLTGQLAGQAVSQFGGAALNQLTGTLFDLNTHAGNVAGTLLSSAGNSAFSTISKNLMNGNNITQNLGKNVSGSLASTGVGLASNYLGLGISKAVGNSALGRGVGAGVGTAASIYGGQAVSKALGLGAKAASSGATAASGASKVTQAAGAINPYGAAMTIAGAALGAATGPSKEYGGKYGKVTQYADMAYDGLTAAVNVVPGFGLIVSGAMALNKGLSNVFGSTSGMTLLDSILGSAFTPAPIKWANVLTGKTTSTFRNLSWQNQEKTNAFMLNGFGDLQGVFSKASEVAGKTYGGMSRHAFKKAQNTVNRANAAYGKVLAMADLNELQNIRSLMMTSINNQRYAQDIEGGYNPIEIGRMGMKILNNATNHNMGMRLLSAAALIDNKQMILSHAKSLIA